MFSGIIEGRAKLIDFKKTEKGFSLQIEAETEMQDLHISDSLCVNGICLTIVKKKGKIIVFDVLHETYQRTGLKNLQTGDSLNLERALKLGDRLGGHFVTGHIDGVGQIKKIIDIGQDRTLIIQFPSDLATFVAQKGSIAVEGVSLTLGVIKANTFEVYLIPYTLNQTNLGCKKLGDGVNLEVDILARYAVGSKTEKEPSKITQDFLKEHGFF